MYELRIYKKAEKEIKKIAKLYQKALLEALREIGENPFAGKPLSRELTGRFSYRVGPYRIIYKVNKKDKLVLVLTAGHRAIVYK